MRQNTPRVILYSTTHCGYCGQAKAFLRKHKIPFSEYDVERNRRAFTDFQRAGGRGVPLILIGKDKVPGFDPGKLSKALRKAGFDV